MQHCFYPFELRDLHLERVVLYACSAPELYGIDNKILVEQEKYELLNNSTRASRDTSER